MRPYVIKKVKDSMIIINRETKQKIAEYKIGYGINYAIKKMRETLNDHLDNNGTSGNYQF